MDNQTATDLTFRTYQRDVVIQAIQVTAANIRTLAAHYGDDTLRGPATETFPINYNTMVEIGDWLVFDTELGCGYSWLSMTPEDFARLYTPVDVQEQGAAQIILTDAMVTAGARVADPDAFDPAADITPRLGETATQARDRRQQHALRVSRDMLTAVLTAGNGHRRPDPGARGEPHPALRHPIVHV